MDRWTLRGCLGGGAGTELPGRAGLSCLSSGGAAALGGHRDPDPGQGLCRSQGFLGSLPVWRAGEAPGPAELSPARLLPTGCCPPEMLFCSDRGVTSAVLLWVLLLLLFPRLSCCFQPLL